MIGRIYSQRSYGGNGAASFGNSPNSSTIPVRQRSDALSGSLKDSCTSLRVTPRPQMTQTERYYVAKKPRSGYPITQSKAWFVCSAIFGQSDGHLCIWLENQIQWFLALLRDCLQLCRGLQADAVCASALPAGEGAREAAPLFDLQDVAVLYRQTHAASLALRRVQCGFFPAAALIFDAYVVAFHWRVLAETERAFVQVGMHGAWRHGGCRSLARP